MVPPGGVREGQVVIGTITEEEKHCLDLRFSTRIIACNPGAVSAASLEDVTGLDTDATPPPSLADCDLTVQGCNPLIPDFDGAATLSISLSVLVVAAALTP